MSGEELDASVLHSGLRFHVPGAWRDDTAIAFSSPPRSADSVALTGKPAPEYISNFRVEMISAEYPPNDADAYLDELVKGLTKAKIDVSPVRREAVSICGATGRMMENRLVVDGQLVRQLQAVAKLGSVWILAIGSTPEHAHAREIPTLMKMIESIERAE
ncbi:MAG: hypothetical protein AAF654_04350 [Myxococcota bacterium]